MPSFPQLEGLTGLRGLAALAVFGVHFNQIVHLQGEIWPFDLARLLANGKHGVSLFFTLSGFLLSLPFWHSLKSGGRLPALKVYALRRLARIVPAYFVALTLLVLLGGLWRFPQLYPDLLLHYTFLFNATEFSIFSINAPFWTLAVEMQFYAVLPLVFLLVARFSGGWRPVVLLLLGLGAYAAHYALMGSVTQIVSWPLDPRFTWIQPYGAVLSHSPLAHLPHFLLGVVSAWLFLHLPGLQGGTAVDRSWVPDLLFAGALMATFLILATPADDAIQIPFGRYGLPLVPTLLAVLIVTAPSTRLAAGWLQSAPIRGLGLVSYGFYIYHVPSLNWVDRWMADGGVDAAESWLLFGALAFALSLTLAAASYVLVERPTLAWVRRRYT